MAATGRLLFASVVAVVVLPVRLWGMDIMAARPRATLTMVAAVVVGLAGRVQQPQHQQALWAA